MSKANKSTKEPVDANKKAILLRITEGLDSAIDRAINLGLANNKSEFIRQSVVDKLLKLNLFELPQSDLSKVPEFVKDKK